MYRCSVLTALLLAAGSSLFASADTDLLALVPASSKIVGSVDVARTRSSGFGQFMLSKMTAEDGGFRDFISETGFDPRQDLQTMVFTSPGPTSGGGKQENFAVLARGTFDQNKIEAAAIKKGAVVRQMLGLRVIVPHPKQSRDVVFTFPLGGVLLMGDLDSVQSILQNRANPAVLDPNLQKEIDAVSSSSDAWFASIAGGSALSRHFSMDANGEKQDPAQVFNSILRSSGGIQFGDMNQIQFDAVARSAKDATSLRDVVRFFASMVQMQRDKDPRAGILAPSLDSMNLQSSGDRVNVSFSIPEKDFEKLAELGPPKQGVSVHPK